MRTITVTMDISKTRVDALSPGDAVKFIDAHKWEAYRHVDGKLETYTRYSDLRALLVSVEPLTASNYEVTIVTKPHNAMLIKTAELQGRLTIDPEAKVKVIEPRKCYVTRRKGNERRSIEIPCTN